jgi:membrane protease YdiL (CAAX protease family)
MKSTTYKFLEFFIVFILTPISFTLNYSIWLKLAIGIFGFIYVVFVLLKIENKKFKIASHLNWNSFWKQTAVKLIVIALLTTLFVYFTDKESLYQVLINKPLKWMLILFVYSVFSVYPQELIYRTFFFQRFQSLFKNQNLFIFMNAIVFSLAHLFFRNTFVLIITFLGGILFALTYSKTKSTLMVSIEHALYGCWLFTVGMGEMLGFPS